MRVCACVGACWVRVWVRVGRNVGEVSHTKVGGGVRVVVGGAGVCVWEVCGGGGGGCTIGTHVRQQPESGSGGSRATKHALSRAGARGGAHVRRGTQVEQRLFVGVVEPEHVADLMGESCLDGSMVHT